jgi:AraC-like DNA-binding protein
MTTTRMHWTGFTWHASPALVPRLVTAAFYTALHAQPAGRYVHPFWILDYSRNHCGRVRVGSPKAPWLERPPGIAHLYPPGTPFWEDTPNVVEGANVMFVGGEEVGLRACLPQGQSYGRIHDPDRRLLSQIQIIATIGAENGGNGFCDAQAALYGLIQLLHRLVPDSSGTSLVFGATTPEPSELVKAVNAFLASRVGGHVSLPEIAKAVRVSPSTLSHRYAAETGHAPLTAFNSMRLKMAQSLILRGLKLEAVAAQTGFTDAFHLSKMFKRHFAVSPAVYRRQIKAAKQ